VAENRIEVQGKLGGKVRPPSQPISQLWWFMPVVPATQEAMSRRITV
jgi:hypothetical protein